MAKIFLKNLTKIFKGSVVAVNNVNIEIEGGIVTAILGPSGCGKTTTMRLIAGFECPTSGKILFDLKDVTELGPYERKVGMVFQMPVLYDDLSVYENIAMPLLLSKEPKNLIDKRVEEMCEFFDIPFTSLPRKARGLSIADRQRVALAHAFIVDRSVYLLDEPLSNLDPKSRVEIRSRLKKYQNKARKTIIYVTHDQTEAMSLAEKIAIMKEGVILQYDKTESVYNFPKNTFVGWFIGNPGMNFIKNIEFRENRLLLEDLGLSFDIGLDKVSTLKSAGEIVLGIRPEYVVLSSEPLEGSVKATCELIEPIGNRMVVHLRRGEVVIRAKIEKTKDFAVGKDLWFFFPQDKVLLFKADTGDLINVNL